VLAPHYSRLSIGEYRERLDAAVAGRAERFPALAAAVADAAAGGQDQALDFGLDRILDGLDALVRSRG